MIKILWLSTNLSRIAKGTEGFGVDGETVGECINEVTDMVPALKDVLFYQSRLNANIEVQVNRQTIDGTVCLTRKVKDGDEIRIALKAY